MSLGRRAKSSDGGKKLFQNTYESPMGKITMTSDGKALKGLWIEGQHIYRESLGEMPEQMELPVFAETKRWLDIFFAGGVPDFTPELAPEGSAFRRRVWEILRDIPYGEVRTYGDIAAQIAAETGKKRMAAQAVGGISNRILIFLPFLFNLVGV